MRKTYTRAYMQIIVLPNQSVLETSSPDLRIFDSVDETDYYTDTAY